MQHACYYGATTVVLWCYHCVAPPLRLPLSLAPRPRKSNPSPRSKIAPWDSMDGGRQQSFRLPGGYLILHAVGMAVTLPIRRMSRADKLRAMEALWADLNRDEAEMSSPSWHGAVLRETEQLVRAGKAKFSDWPTASRRIHRNLKSPHGNSMY